MSGTQATTAKTRYRYRCSTCGTHGRWRINPNDAHADGERHFLRFAFGHDTQLVDSHEKNHGSCH